MVGTYLRLLVDGVGIDALVGVLVGTYFVIPTFSTLECGEIWGWGWMGLPIGGSLEA